MNIHLPQNGAAGNKGHLEPDGARAPFNLFGIVLAGIFLAACGMLTLIRWWRWEARRKFAGLRQSEVPSFKEGYWGWA